MCLLCRSQKIPAWANVGGSPQDQRCIIGGYVCADRGELAGRAANTTGAEMAGAAVPVLKVGHIQMPAQWAASLSGRLQDGQLRAEMDAGDV